MIVGVTGYLAAGKDTVANYLIEKGFHHYSLSDELRAIVSENGLPNTRDNQVKIANELRAQYGADYLAKRVLDKLTEPAVITSIRTPGEVETLKAAGTRIIFVDAPIEMRYERIRKRKREGEEVLSFDEFKAQEEREKSAEAHKQQLHTVAAMADYTVINDSTLDELYVKIDKIIKEVENAR